MMEDNINWIKQNSFVDAKDKDGDWQVGYVLSLTNSEVKIRFDGWSSKSDETFPINSQKLKPFRTIVRGYTGYKKSVAVRQHWIFSQESHQQKIIQFQSFIKDLKQKTNQNINQYLRGEYYLYLDFLLTNTYKTAQQLQRVYDYIHMFIDFTLDYLNYLLIHNHDQWFIQSNQYTQGYYQYLDGLCITFAFYPRQFLFVKQNQRLIRLMSQDEDTNHQIEVVKYMVPKNFVGIFQALIQKIGDFGQTLPLSFLYSIFHLYQVVQKTSLFDKQIKKSTSLALFQIIKKQMLNLSVSSLKTDQKQIENILTEMKSIFRYRENYVVYKWIEETRLKIYCLLLSTQSLDKRLKGIMKIKQFFQGIILNQNIQGIVHISQQEYKNFISSQNILEIIFQQNQHSETIKKGCQLARLLFLYQIIGTNQLIFIWNVCKSKHQAVRRIIYNLWLQIDLKPQWIKQVASVVLLQIFQNDWQVEFIIDFTGRLILKDQLNSSTQIVLQRAYECCLKNNGQIERLARVIGVNSKANSKICQKLIQQCFTKIQQRDQSAVHLHLVKELIFQFYGRDVTIPQGSIEILIKQIHLVVKQPNPQKYLNMIFDLINQLVGVTSPTIDLSMNNFIQLWQLFRQDENMALKAIFYNWILYQSKQGFLRIKYIQINSRFTDQLIINFFRTILLDSRKIDYANLTIEEFYMFKQFLLKVNILLSKIQLIEDSSGIRIFRVNDTQIEGIAQLWAIFQQCRNQQTIQLLTTFIKDLHLKISDRIPAVLKRSQVDTLITKLQTNINEGIRKSNFKLIKHSLTLFIKLIQDVSQRYVPSIIHQTSNNSSKFNLKIYENNRQIGQIEIFFTQIFYGIKQRMAKILNIPIDSFTILSLGKEIPQQLYSIPYYALRLSQQQDSIRIVRVENQIKKMIFNFIKDNLNQNLQNLLTNKEVCGQAFIILQQIDNNSNQARFVDRVMEKNINLSQQTLYFNYHFMKVFSFVKVTKSRTQILNKIINQISFEINSDICVSFIQCFMQILMKAIEQNQKPTNKDIPQIVVKILISEIKYLNSRSKMTNRKRQYNLLAHIFKCLELLLNQKLLSFFLNLQSLDSLFKLIFIEHKFDLMKSYICQKFQTYCQLYKPHSHQQNNLIQVFAQIYQIVRLDRLNMRHYPYFFKMMSISINLASPQYVAQLSAGQNSLYKLFLKSVYEESQQLGQSNSFLEGHLLLLCSVYNKCSELINLEIGRYLIEDGLLLTIESSIPSKKYKMLNTINISLKLLQVLCQKNVDIHQMVIKNLLQVHKITYWRNSEHWNVMIDDEKKSQTGYVGLQNPGCICYLNSFMQQLFMIEPFRNQVLQIKNIKQSIDKKEDTKENRAKFINNLKILFLKLMYSDLQYINPLFFTESLKDAFGKPIIKIYQQMDIDEYCSILFDRIENCVPEDSNFVKQLFGGIYSNEIISKECSHSSERQQSFLSISLQVKKTLIESFQSLVKGQILESENAYYCQRCDKKVKAQKRLSLKKIPSFLMISLKRFEFNFDLDVKIKINDYCQFPTTLDLKDFSHQKMHSKDHIDSEKIHISQTKFIYTLKGVVVHTGFADSGHYYAFIEDKDHKWFEFNDNKVCEFDPRFIGQEAFGGKSAQGHHQKIKNAYILIYERKNKNIQQKMETQQMPQNSVIVKQIIEENKKISKFEIVFSEEYRQFIEKITKIQYHPYLNDMRDSLLASYFLSVGIRTKNFNNIFNIGYQLIESFQSNSSLALKYLQQFTNESIIEELLIKSPIQKGRIISYTIIQAAKFILNKINFQSSVFTQTSEVYLGLINYFLRSILKVIAKIQSNHMIACFTLKKLALSNNYVTKFLTSINTMNIILENMKLGTFLTTQNSIQQIDDKFFNQQLAKKSLIGINNYKQSLSPSKVCEKQAWELLCVIYCANPQYFKSIVVKIQQLPQQKLIFLIHQSVSLKRIVAMSQFLTKCSTANINFTTKIITTIQKALIDLQSIAYRQFLLLTYKMVMIDDTIKQIRIKMIIQALKASFIGNLKYFVECDFISQWIIKICSHSKNFLTIFQNHNFLDIIIKWLDKNSTPCQETLKKHVSKWLFQKNPACERLLQRMHGIVVSSEMSDYQELSNQKISDYQNIKLGNFVKRQFPLQPSPYQQFHKGQQIHYFYHDEWKNGKIIDNNFGYLKLEINDVIIQVWQDFQKIKIAKVQMDTQI